MMPQEQVSHRPPVPWGTTPEGPDWADFAARRIAGHVAEGDETAARVYVHELQHGLHDGHPPVDPWQMLTALAVRLAAAVPRPDPEPEPDPAPAAPALEAPPSAAAIGQGPQPGAIGPGQAPAAIEAPQVPAG